MRQVYVPNTFTPEQKDAFKTWAQENPGTSRDFIKLNPEMFRENASPVPQASPLEVPKEAKSKALRKFEQDTILDAGDPTWNLYGRVRGAWKFIGNVDDPSNVSIAEEFGGGRYMVRMVDPATGAEVIGLGKSRVFDIHEGVFGASKYPAPAIEVIRREEGIEGVEGEDVRFTAEDLKAAEEKAAKDAELKQTIAALQARAFAPDTPKEDRLDMLQKLVELQKALMPAPAIGEAKSMTDTIAGIAGAVTSAFAAWQQIKGLMPRPVAEPSAGGGMVERVFSTLAEKVGTRMLEGGLTAAQEAPPPAGGPTPSDTEKKMFDSMMDELAMEIAKQQEIEATTQADTVGTMVSWILDQKGMAWDILRMQARTNDLESVVAFISSKRPTLASDEFKNAWLKNVVEVLKTPEGIGK